ncbi:MAG: hypothetical protein ACYSTL_01750 [Planctomycetota bacterium]
MGKGLGSLHLIIEQCPDGFAAQDNDRKNTQDGTKRDEHATDGGNYEAEHVTGPFGEGSPGGNHETSNCPTNQYWYCTGSNKNPSEKGG